MLQVQSSRALECGPTTRTYHLGIAAQLYGELRARFPHIIVPVDFMRGGYVQKLTELVDAERVKVQMAMTHFDAALGSYALNGLGYVEEGLKLYKVYRAKTSDSPNQTITYQDYHTLLGVLAECLNESLQIINLLSQLANRVKLIRALP